MSRAVFRSMLEPAVVIGGTLLLLDAGCGGRIDPGEDLTRGDWSPDEPSPDDPPPGEGDGGAPGVGGRPGRPGGDGGAPNTGARPGRAGGPGVGGRPEGAGGQAPPPPPPPPRCGNGRVNAGEDCDGVVAPDVSCSMLTMGAAPFGQVLCTSDCRFDLSRCTWLAGSGGAPTSTGGASGTGGATADRECFRSDGVPWPRGSGLCAQGDLAVRACLTDYWPSAGRVCEAACGCQACPGVMAACGADPACAMILSCTIDAGCETLADCNASGCAGLIELSGGANSAGSRLARRALRCLSQADCQANCP